MIVFSTLLMPLYAFAYGVRKLNASTDVEWWDLTQDEKDELIDAYVDETEYEELEGTFPDGWFDLEDWEKRAILDKNLDDYYNEQSEIGTGVQRDFEQTNRSIEHSRCTIV